MVRAAALIALLVAAPAIAQITPEEDAWLAEHAANGVDVTPDGLIWVTVGTTSSGSKYSLLLRDLLKTGGKSGPVWIIGFHKNDSTVPYRTSKSRVQFDCGSQKMQTLSFVTLRADGSVLSERLGRYNPWGDTDVVPGSLGEAWLETACWNKN